MSGGSVVLRFTEAARLLGVEAHARGWTSPAFRAPPRDPGLTRSIRRHAGGAVVAVTLKDRPFDDVLVDMVDGLLAANRIASLQTRAEVLFAVTSELAGRGLAPGEVKRFA